MTSRVEWITDGKYKNSLYKINESKMKSLIGIKYEIEIIEIDKNKIICRTESDGISVKKEMIKIGTKKILLPTKN